MRAKFMDQGEESQESKQKLVGVGNMYQTCSVNSILTPNSSLHSPNM